jgi:transposase
LERTRFRAIELLKGGKRPSEVAALLGVSRPSVSIWKKAHETSGLEGLKAKPHPGPAPKLTLKQLERLGRLLLKGPTAHGYPTELWTLRRVGEVIEQHFGVSYESSAVWRVLRRLGWSCQKPERRARERDESAIVRWRQVDWPRIKKRPRSRS